MGIEELVLGVIFLGGVGVILFIWILSIISNGITKEFQKKLTIEQDVKWFDYKNLTILSGKITKIKHDVITVDFSDGSTFELDRSEIIQPKQ